MAIIEIQKEIWLETPKGQGIAHFLMDNGPEADLYWIVALENGECWTFANPDIRFCKNITLGREND